MFRLPAPQSRENVRLSAVSQAHTAIVALQGKPPRPVVMGGYPLRISSSRVAELDRCAAQPPCNGRRLVDTRNAHQQPNARLASAPGDRRTEQHLDVTRSVLSNRDNQARRGLMKSAVSAPLTLAQQARAAVSIAISFSVSPPPVGQSPACSSAAA